MLSGIDGKPLLAALSRVCRSFNRTEELCDMKRGNALRLVIATVLVSGGAAATVAYAGGYCTLSACYVWGTAPPGWGSGGGGSGSFDNTQTYGQPDAQAVCEDLSGHPEPNCNINNPPPLVQNGCGSASIDVPDFLVSFTNAAAAASYGGIFRAACNKHDVCYGTSWQTKAWCDADLKNDMIRSAKDRLPNDVYLFFKADVERQASTYSSGLQWGPIEAFVSGPAWSRAQIDARCRTWSDAMKYYCR